jgi:hypothetical protein
METDLAAPGLILTIFAVYCRYRDIAGIEYEPQYYDGSS